jgi:superfamily II DNA or RNA helicase
MGLAYQVDYYSYTDTYLHRLSNLIFYRIWKDHVFLLGSIDLLLIDEVHHLGEERGATLEMLVVRMRMLSEVYKRRVEVSGRQLKR